MISASLHKNKLKALKKQIKQSRLISTSQLRQIKELSDLYSLSLDRGPLSTQDASKRTTEVKQAKLMRQICESNYHLV